MADQSITITLPFPKSKLNPNQSKGRHWGSTRKDRKQARADAYWLSMEAFSGHRRNGGKLPAKTAESIGLSIAFVQPDRCKRDRDNLFASLKHGLDGIADALGIDDSKFEPIVLLPREYGNAPGAVRVTINYIAES